MLLWLCFFFFFRISIKSASLTLTEGFESEGLPPTAGPGTEFEDWVEYELVVFLIRALEAAEVAGCSVVSEELFLPCLGLVLVLLMLRPTLGCILELCELTLGGNLAFSRYGKFEL